MWRTIDDCQLYDHEHSCIGLNQVWPAKSLSSSKIATCHLTACHHRIIPILTSTPGWTEVRFDRKVYKEGCGIFIKPDDPKVRVKLASDVGSVHI